jgi:hypothetical protein
MVQDERKYDQNHRRAGMTSYEEKVESFKNRILLLPDGVSVDATADRLERMNWVPELLITVRDFHRVSKDVLLSNVVAVLSLNDNEMMKIIGSAAMPPERVRLTQASLLVNAAELLWKLRSDDPLAWDHVNELYEDD